MKKINILLISLLVGMGFYSCQKDEIVTINPAAEKGNLTFVLNKTQYDNFTFVLDEANNGLNMDELTTQQPDYGFTAAVTYYIQASFNQNMKDSVELNSSVQGEKVAINVKDMNKAMLQLYKGTMPNPTVTKDVYVRLRAVVSDATATPLISAKTVKSAFSNAIKLNIKPYFMEDLVSYEKAKKLKLWYLIGYSGWNIDMASLGTSTFPFSVVEGNKYDSEGNGTYKYSGYFEASKSFKVVGDLSPNDPSGWSGIPQWGNDGGEGINKPVMGANPSNFKVPTDGYYVITLNSILKTLTIEADKNTHNLYANMGLVGEMTSWGTNPDIAMTAYQATNNHAWHTTYTFAAKSQCKFRFDSKWDTNWGTPAANDGDPLYSYTGVGKPGGKNMVQEPGTYVVLFNDIDGGYYFIKK